MDRTTPESLIQFLDNATTSVRAALERPVEGTSNSASELLQKHVFTNISPTRERRRFKGHSKRRRARNLPNRHNSLPELWRDGYNPQPQCLSEILGIPDPCSQGALQEPHLNKWEDKHQWSPNLNREYTDESLCSPGCMADWQTQHNGDFTQARTACLYSSSPAYPPKTDYGYGRDVYPQTPKSHYSYKHKHAPQTLDEVVNMMPVGCHLPPPLPSVCNIQANHQVQEVDAVSKKMMPLILGIPEKEGFHDPPGIANPRQRHISPVSLDSQAQNNSESTPPDLDLLSQLVTELDKTNTFYKMVAESSVYQQPCKEITVEDLRNLSRDCTDCYPTCDDNGRVGQTGFESNMSSNPDRRKYGGGQMLANRSLSMDLACALKDTHIGSTENPTFQGKNMPGCEAKATLQNRNVNSADAYAACKKPSTLKRSSSFRYTLQADTTFGNVRCNTNMETQSRNKYPSKWKRSNGLQAMHEHKSMPNLYPPDAGLNYTSQYALENRSSLQVHQRLVKLRGSSRGGDHENTYGWQSGQHLSNSWERTTTGINNDGFKQGRSPQTSHHDKHWIQMKSSVVTDPFNQGQYQPEEFLHQGKWNRSDRMNLEEVHQDKSTAAFEQNTTWIEMDPRVSPDGFNQVKPMQTQHLGGQWTGIDPKAEFESNQDQPSKDYHQNRKWNSINPSVNCGEFNHVPSEQQGLEWVRMYSSVNAQESNKLYGGQYQSSLPGGENSPVSSVEFNQGFKDSNMWTTNAVEGAVRNVSPNLPIPQWHSLDSAPHVSSDLLTNYERTDIQFNNSVSNDGSAWSSEEEGEDEDEDEYDNEKPMNEGKADDSSSTSVVPLPSFSTFLQK